MNKEVIIAIIGLVAATGAVVLTFVWFDWRLFVVMFLYQFAHNLEKHRSR